MSHTPRPWTMFQGTKRKPRSKRRLIMYGVNGPEDKDGWVTRICDCATEDQGGMRANALLIAAAPDLLEACRGLLGTCALNLDDQEDDDIAACVLARAAVAKAEGR